MGKKLISFCLFLLFCIVVAFPGYGRGRSATKTETSSCAQIKNAGVDKITFEGLMKKCLAEGISIAEEERPVEENETETEDEVNPGIEEDTLFLDLITLFPNTLVWNVSFSNTDNNYQTVALRGVPNPPPECVLS